MTQEPPMGLLLCQHPIEAYLNGDQLAVEAICGLPIAKNSRGDWTHDGADEDFAFDHHAEVGQGDASLDRLQVALDVAGVESLTARLASAHPNATVTDALIAGYLMGWDDRGKPAPAASLDRLQDERRLTEVEDFINWWAPQHADARAAMRADLDAIRSRAALPESVAQDEDSALQAWVAAEGVPDDDWRSRAGFRAGWVARAVNPEVGAQDGPVHPVHGVPVVRGRCPECGSASLILGSGGYVTCGWLSCPDPLAPSHVLERAPEPASSLLDDGQEAIIDGAHVYVHGMTVDEAATALRATDRLAEAWRVSDDAVLEMGIQAVRGTPSPGAFAAMLKAREEVEAAARALTSRPQASDDLLDALRIRLATAAVALSNTGEGVLATAVLDASDMLADWRALADRRKA